jgi:mevalonate kinase
LYIIKVPLKVTLLGEYAVVFGKPAIASTLPVYMIIRVSECSDKSSIRVKLNGISVPIISVSINRDDSKYMRVSVNEGEVEKMLQYIIKAIYLCENELRPGTLMGFDIEIQSPVPPGVGLGTSAATSVGLVAACFAMYMNEKRVDKDLVAKIAWRTEQIVQGAASPMDTYTITFGGLRYIEPLTPRTEPLLIPKKPSLVIGYTLKRFTTADLVSSVKKKMALMPAVISKIIETIGVVVEEAKKSLLSGDIQSLGTLMNLNHGLLDSLGVVSNEHHLIVNTLRNSGALGAKTSGAGGGGAFIALAKSDADAMMLSRVSEALGAKIVSLELGSSGVEITHV